MISRAEHIAWCKQRALEYWALGEYQNALNSMMSDLGKHNETKGHAGIQLTVMLMMGGFLKTDKEVHDHILGFN